MPTQPRSLPVWPVPSLGWGPTGPRGQPRQWPRRGEHGPLGPGPWAAVKFSIYSTILSRTPRPRR